jgi:hypothetical protein
MGLVRIQMSHQLFITDGGDIGSVAQNTRAEVHIGDEVFLFDDVPLALVLRRKPASESEHHYTFISCARMPAAEAHTEAKEEVISGSERVQISIV